MVEHNIIQIRRGKLDRRVVWQLIDTLLILLVYTPALFSQNPVNPDASPEARALLKFLYDCKGKHLITGIHNNQGDPSDYYRKIHKLTGEYTGVWGNDFRYGEHVKYRQRVVDEAIRQWRSGSIVTLMYHQVRPQDSETSSGWSSVQGELSQAEWKDLVTPGTVLHRQWLKKIDNVAGYLKQLRDTGVPVLWRPYHEMNGGWFWWGHWPGPNGYEKLWHLMYDRYVNHHQLHNLLWVFNPNAPNRAEAPDTYFPGHDVVDVLGYDYYGDDPYQQDYYDQFNELAQGKPLAIAECGPLPDPNAILQYQKNFVWFMGWRDVLFKENSESDLKRIWTHPACLNRGDFRLHESSIRIDTQFDRGSLGPAKVIGDTLVRAQTMHWIKRDMIGNQFYWFYFKISSVKGKTITFELSNMAGTYRGKFHGVMNGILKPVISYDNERWSRIMETHFDPKSRVFRFSHTFTEDQAWIAYAHPYPKCRGDKLIGSLRQKNADIEIIGKSPLGNDIHLLTFPPQAVYTPDKRIVLVLALQHAGEDCGGFFVEGMIEALQRHSDLSDRFIYKIVPMMNPDGLLQGVTRYNYNMEDLNPEWDDDSSDTNNLPVEPEVKAVKSWIKGWQNQGCKIDFAIDVHSHTQRAGDCAIHIRDQRLKRLVEEISHYWPIRTVVKGPNPGKGNCLNYFTDELNTLAVTMELSQSHNGDGKFLTIADYQQHGHYFVQAIDAFFSLEGKAVFPDVSALNTSDVLPDPFIKPDGTRVKSRAEWTEQRDYFKAMLAYYQYGEMPSKPEHFDIELLEKKYIMDDTMIQEEFFVILRRNGQQAQFKVALRRPNRSGCFPVIIKNDSFLFDLSEMKDNAKREKYQRLERDKIESYATDQANQRGYVLCKFNRNEVAADRADSKSTGVLRLYPEYTWGTIAAWAWAYQIVIDHLKTQPYIDADKIVATGHSRGGKSALCAGIYDERITITAPNSSGSGGTGSWNYFDPDKSKQVVDYHKERFHYWWTPRLFEFVGQSRKMPFDAHIAKALIAPRGLINPHSREDYWANPYGTYLTYLAANRVYEWLDVPDHQGLHWRNGPHNQNQEDWYALFEFCDQYFFDNASDLDFTKKPWSDKYAYDGLINFEAP